MKKNINLLSVFCLAIGASLGSGFFLLPGLMALRIGDQVWLFFLLAVLPMIPAALSMIELSTAFPKSAGIYYALSRTLGPMIGTVVGMGSWLLMVFKIGFILQGIGIYLAIITTSVNPAFISLIALLLLTLINLFGAKRTVSVQNTMVIISLVFLGLLFTAALWRVDTDRSFPLIDYDAKTGVEVTGILFMSYIGLTKVIGVSGEIDNPERNISRGLIISTLVAVGIYVLGAWLFTYSVPAAIFNGTPVPVAAVAEYHWGSIGRWAAVGVAGVTFFAAANASFMSAARYPMAMGQDKLLPDVMAKMNPAGVPHYSIGTTFGAIAAVILFLDPILLAKSAGAFQFLIFILICIAVIIIRESGIKSYLPGFRNSGYPWLQTVGIITGLYFVFNLGFAVLLFSVLTVLLSVVLYTFYGKKRTKVTAALFHLFARLAHHRSDDLDREFRNILKEKGLRTGDQYNPVICRAGFEDADETDSFDSVYRKAANYFSRVINTPADDIYRHLREGAKIGATPVTRGAALPHMKSDRIQETILFIVRSTSGIIPNPEGADDWEREKIYAFFFLISPTDDPGQHLRILAGLAAKIDAFDLSDEWNTLPDTFAIREFLLNPRFFTKYEVTEASATIHSGMSVEAIRDQLQCYPVFIHRGQIVIEYPQNTVNVFSGDILSLIGEEEPIRRVNEAVRQRKRRTKKSVRFIA